MIKYILMGLILSSLTVAEEQSKYLQQAKQVDENVWIGPQPSAADYGEFAADEIMTVISTRTEKEMQGLGFSSAEQAKKHGIHYSLIEIGEGHPYTPAKLESFNQLMQQHTGEKMVLHCRSGHRVSQLYAAWLVKYQNQSPAEALKAIHSEEQELSVSMQELLGQ